jgi:hypothetical protein
MKTTGDNFGKLTAAPKENLSKSDGFRKFAADQAAFEAAQTAPAKSQRQKNKYGEKDIQKAVTTFLDSIGALWQHTPNDGLENGAKYGAKMKMFGMKAGVPDIQIYNPSFDGNYIGFAIELKYGKNQLSAQQKTWLNSLARCGWHTAVCYSTDDAIKEIETYFNISEPYKKIQLP